MPKSAPEATPPAGNRFVEFDEFIDYQLNKASRTIQMTDILVGVVGAALGLTVYLLVFILADHWLVSGGLGSWARLIYWAIGCFALGYWIVTRLFRPMNARVNALYAARAIEKTQPTLKSSLLTLTDLKQAGRPTAGHIRGSLEKRAAVSLAKTDVDEAIDRGALMTCSYILLFLLASFCGYALFSPKSILQSAWRALVPFTDTGVATRTRIDSVKPGNAEVPALSHLDVEVEVSGEAPEEATLYYSTADGAFVNEPVPLRETGEGLRRYRGTVIGADGRGLRQNLTYHVVAGDAQSATFSVTVAQSPSAVVDAISYHYQPYTGLGDKDEAGGAIDAWEGTKVTIKATANQPVKSAMVLFSDSEDTSVKAEELPMLVSQGTKLTADWQLAFRSDRTFPKFYHVQVKTEEGYTDPVPTLHPVNIRPDLPPQVEVLAPKADIKAPVNGFVAIAYRAKDPDFRLRSLVLNLEHDGQVLISSPRLFQGPPDEEAREGVHTLRLRDFNLAAGSRLTYWIEARDNFEPFDQRDPNRTLTPRMNIDLIDPQPPAQAQQQEKAAAEQANQALQDSRPQDGQPGDAPPQGPPKAEEKPDPGNGRPQDDQAASDPPQNNPPGAENDPAQPAPDRQPGDKPQPGNQPNDTQKRQDGSSQPREKPGDANGPQQQSENGRPMNDGQPGQGQQKQPGQTGRTSQGDQGQGDKSPGNSGSGEKGAAGNSSPNPSDKPQPGKEPGPRDRAPDDVAMQKLIDWANRQNQQQPKQDGNTNPQNSEAPNPAENRPPGDSGKTPPQPDSPGQQTPGNDPQGASGSQPGDKPSDPKAPSSPMDSPPGGGQPGEQQPPGNSNQKSGNDSANGEKPGEQGAGNRSAGEQPSADQRPGNKSGGQPGEKSGETTSPMKSSSTEPGDRPGEAKPDSGNPGTPARSNDPSAPESKPTDQKPNANDPNSEQPGNTAARPGEEKSDSPKNSESPSQAPKNGQPGQPGEQPQNSQPGQPKDGATAQPSQGKESPTGAAGDRTQPGNQPRQSPEKAGNSTEKPVGNSDDMGTRNNGAGQPGSSQSGESGGQKSAGQGEPGKNGEQSSSGSKSGDQQSGGGKPSNSSGSKPGGESGSQSPSKSGGNDSGKPDAKSDGQSPSGSDDKGPNGKGSGGGDKPLDKPSGGSADDKSSGGSGEKPGSEQSSSGQQPGGEQSRSGGDSSKSGGEQSKAGGEQGNQQGGGQQAGNQKSQGGQDGGSQQGGAPGDSSSQQPGSQSGSKGGAGGASGHGEAAAPGNGAGGEGTAPAGTPDQVDLENRKKAANLALKRLQETLERGQIDPELQKELGYSDEELRTFMDRLQERLADNGDDNSPEAQARRRQFESLLKGINTETQTGRREAGAGSEKAASGFGAARRPAPPEYRAAEQRYRDSLSGRKPSK